MPRTFKQNNEIKELRRKEIIEKSLVLFAKEGFDKVTMDDIAKAAKCSHGLMYHYFKNKDEILHYHEIECKKLFTDEFKKFLTLYEPGVDFIKECNRVLVNSIYISKKTAYYLYLFLTLRLENINNGSQNYLSDKEVTAYFKKSVNVFLALHTSENKKDLMYKVLLYASYLSGLAINRVKYPYIFEKPVDPDETLDSFFR